jgi:hypothetical protein
MPLLVLSGEKAGGPVLIEQGNGRKQCRGRPDVMEARQLHDRRTDA